MDDSAGQKTGDELVWHKTLLALESSLLYISSFVSIVGNSKRSEVWSGFQALIYRRGVGVAIRANFSNKGILLLP